MFFFFQQIQFLRDDLLKELQERDTKQSSIQIIPYAFDLSPDVENYVPLANNSDLEPELVGAKLAKLTTFMTPLDENFLGQ